MGEFQNRKWKEIFQPNETSVNRWSSPGEEKKRPPNKNDKSKNRRYQPETPLGEDCDKFLKTLLPLKQFLDGQQKCGHKKGEKIVDAPVSQKHAKDL